MDLQRDGWWVVNERMGGFTEGWVTYKGVGGLWIAEGWEAGRLYRGWVSYRGLESF
jgi:hypothetical protein